MWLWCVTGWRGCSGRSGEVCAGEVAFMLGSGWPAAGRRAQRDKDGECASARARFERSIGLTEG
jgi:hypothetical protein